MMTDPRTTGWRARARELRAQMAETAEVDWRHPAWWGLTWGAALLGNGTNGAAREGWQLYRGANGGPHSDTFMARDTPTGLDRAERVARAVIGARAAVSSIGAGSGRLPGQPLASALEWRRGWLDPVALSARDAESVVFLTPGGAYRAVVAAGSEERLGRALVGLLRGGAPGADVLVPIERAASAPVPSAVAVSLVPRSLEGARHQHREAWSRGGGPWLGLGLGLGEGDAREVVSTCHRAVDGFGHAQLSAAIFEGVDRGSAELARLLRAQSDGRDDVLSGNDSVARGSREEVVGFAGRVLPSVGRFAEQAYAMGRALERFFRDSSGAGERSRARLSPAFQVPIAPSVDDAPCCRTHLVVHGLLALRMRDGAFESSADFRARLPEWLERQRRGEGILTRLGSAIAGAPLPSPLKRRLLRSRYAPRPWLPPVAALCGRGRLSSIRLAAGERPGAPLYAASMPAMLPGRADPLGGVVLTLVHHDVGCTASVLGTGRAGTAEGAGAFLDLWALELEGAVATSMAR